MSEGAAERPMAELDMHHLIVIHRTLLEHAPFRSWEAWIKSLPAASAQAVRDFERGEVSRAWCRLTGDPPKA